jgi:Xaa-Pro aminopeptidase
VDGLYRGDSFDAIAGAGEHGAIMHYRVTPETDRAIGPRELFLIDSGGQYDDGTTDVTRTIWTGGGEVPRAWRDQFTRVLKGMIALATASFPEGVTGHRLDALARDALWRAGLDFDHGTGHGVGSSLSVHEGPVSISPVHRPVPIREGMVVSDEPGYYEPGSHGIRIENMLLVVRAAFVGAVKPFLTFETLTLAPIDRACIEVGLLTGDERAWIDAYHARVLALVGPSLEGAARAWLGEACAPLV